MGFDFELERMLLKTINVRRVTDVSPGGTAVLGAAIPVLVYLEVIDATKTHTAGATERKPMHWFCTKDWPPTLPGGIKYDDRVWLPGLDPNDETLGKTPDTIEAFIDPEFGDVDHYEVGLSIAR